MSSRELKHLELITPSIVEYVQISDQNLLASAQCTLHKTIVRSPWSLFQLPRQKSAIWANLLRPPNRAPPCIKPRQQKRVNAVRDACSETLEIIVPAESEYQDCYPISWVWLECWVSVWIALAFRHLESRIAALGTCKLCLYLFCVAWREICWFCLFYSLRKLSQWLLFFSPLRWLDSTVRFISYSAYSPERYLLWRSKGKDLGSLGRCGLWRLLLLSLSCWGRTQESLSSSHSASMTMSTI